MDDERKKSRGIFSTVKKFVKRKYSGSELFDAVDKVEPIRVKKLLSEKKSNPNVQNAQHKSVIHQALKTEDPEIINLVLEHPKADLRKPSNGDLNPVQNAAFFGKYKELEILTRIKAAPVNSYDQNHINPLGLAIYSGDLQTIETLLNHPNIDVLHQDMFGDTVLHIAAMQKNFKALELLLKNNIIKQELLEVENNNGQNFIQILISELDFDEEIPEEQLNNLGEVLQSSLLISKSEIDLIQNETLKDEFLKAYYRQCGKIKSSSTCVVPQIKNELEQKNVINTLIVNNEKLEEITIEIEPIEISQD